MPACMMARLHGGEAIDRRTNPIRRVAGTGTQCGKQQFAAQQCAPLRDTGKDPQTRLH
jgi:hypothetical protein